MNTEPTLEGVRNFRRVDPELCTSGQPTEAELASDELANHGGGQ